MLLLNGITSGTSTFAPAPGRIISGTDILLGLFYLIIIYSSPFIYGYFRDKRKRKKRNTKK
jgi:hypothetical protein